MVQKSTDFNHRFPPSRILQDNVDRSKWENVGGLRSVLTSFKCDHWRNVGTRLEQITLAIRFEIENILNTVVSLEKNLPTLNQRKRTDINEHKWDQL